MSILEIFTQQAVSRIVVRGEKIPRYFYNQVSPITKEASKWINVVGDVSKEDPLAWIKIAGRVAGEMVEPPAVQINIFDRWMKVHKMGYAPQVTQWASNMLIDNCEFQPVIKNTEQSIVKTEIDGVEIFIHIINEKERRLMLPHGENRVYEVIRDLFWSKTDSVVVDYAEGRLNMRRFAPPQRDYKGEVLDHIKNLKVYMDEGIRRVIILQGVPGTGKSTLCQNAAQILSKRTIVITPDFVQEIGKEEWSEIIKLLSPTMVICDDIDRIPANRLETNLTLFEDGYYNVPVTLLTTNNQDKLPTAFRRPGRVDQILEMPEPKREIKMEMIKDFARRVKIEEDPPENVMQFMMGLLDKFPPAHLVEIMRRYKVEGWDYVPPPNDLTFGESFNTSVMKRMSQKEAEEKRRV